MIDFIVDYMMESDARFLESVEANLHDFEFVYFETLSTNAGTVYMDAEFLNDLSTDTEATTAVCDGTGRMYRVEDIYDAEEFIMDEIGKRI